LQQLLSVSTARGARVSFCLPELDEREAGTQEDYRRRLDLTPASPQVSTRCSGRRDERTSRIADRADRTGWLDHNRFNKTTQNHLERTSKRSDRERR